MAGTMFAHADHADLTVQVGEAIGCLYLSVNIASDGSRDTTVHLFATAAQMADVYTALAQNAQVIASAGTAFVERTIHAAIALAKVTPEVRDTLERALRGMADDERPTSTLVCDHCGEPGTPASAPA